MLKLLLGNIRYKTLNRIIPYVSGFKKYVIQILALKVYFFIIAAITPLLYKILVDLVLGEKRYDLFGIIAISYFCIFILQSVGSIFNTYVSNKTMIPFICRVKTKLFKKVFTMRFCDYRNYTIGDLKNRIDGDVEKIQNFLHEQCLDYIYLIFNSLVLIFVLLHQNWILALFGLAMIPLSYLTRKVLINKISNLSEKYRNNWGEYETALYGTFQNWKEIRANNLQQKEADRFFKRWAILSAIFLKKEIFLFINRTFISFQRAFLVKMNLYFIGGILVINNVISIGTLLSFMIYYEWLYGSINSLSSKAASLNIDIPFIERVFEILEYDSKIEREIVEDCDEQYILKGKNVRFFYDSNSFKIDNVCFGIKSGQCVALAGHSGAGKTTIANLILNLYQLKGGTLTAFGVPVKNYNDISYNKLVSAVSQETTFFNMSIKENLLLANSHATNDEIIEALQRANIYEFVKNLPLGVDTIIGERGVKLSGGERQRLAIARIILLNPEIIVFDEATASLDSENEAKITDAISSIVRKKTVIIISHRLSSLMAADCVLLIDNGKLICAGTHEELRHNNSVYAKLFKNQYT